jgi:NADPH:quinone reductase-like Zn-dependent oxidoreductase
VNEYGPPESIAIEEVPDPIAGPGDAIVRVHAAAVNFPDVLIAANRYQLSMPVPFTPGSEFAGVVEAVGDEVEAVQVGDRVSGTVLAGAFAEKVAVGSSALRKVPDGVDFDDAAAFGVAHGTAYRVLRSVAAVQPGEWVAVLGAAGGVGLAAVQLAKLLGARVVAAASSDEKLAVCRKLGADAVINYDTEDLKLRLREVTDGGADVVVDPVGGPYAEPALRSTRFGGRYVVVGFASGEIPRIPLNLLLLKGAILMGYEVRGHSINAPELAARDEAELAALFASGRVRPHISSRHPLDDVAGALESVAARRAVGKVMLELA